MRLLILNGYLLILDFALFDSSAATGSAEFLSRVIIFNNALPANLANDIDS